MTSSTSIEVKIAEIAKLDPEATYLIRLSKDFTADDAERLRDLLTGTFGVKNVLVVVGDMEITELKETN